MGRTCFRTADKYRKMHKLRYRLEAYAAISEKRNTHEYY